MNRLREIRESKNMTITQLAEKSGITRQTVYRLEAETVDTANSQTLKRLADALDVQISDFFTEQV